MKNLDEKIEEVKALQAEIDQREQIVREAENLISEGRHSEAESVLKTLEAARNAGRADDD